MADTPPTAKRNTPEKKSLYFDLQAYWGITNHIGGLRATDDLAQRCHINPESYVLVIGCGTGKTSSYLARKHGCHITGIDISPKMVNLAKKQASKDGVVDRTEFQVADAQNLPFSDNEFDAVIAESVNVFIPDKHQTMTEYVRVVKPEKYVGMNEVTWLQPPTPRVAEYLQITMDARPLDAECWQSLMADAGLQEVSAQVSRPKMLTMWLDEMRQMGFREAVTAWGKFFYMLLKGSPEIREFIKRTWPPPWNILKYMGYGIYAGRK